MSELFGQRIEGAASAPNAEVESKRYNHNDITLDGQSKAPFPTLADARAMRARHKQYKTIELRDELAKAGFDVFGREGLRALADLMVEEVGHDAKSADTYIDSWLLQNWPAPPKSRISVHHEPASNGATSPLAGEPAPDSTAPAFEVTLFRNAEGRITKRVELGTNGKLNIDGAPGLYRGTARRVRYDSLANFAEALTRCPANECFGLGQLVDGLEEKVSVVTIEKLNGGATARRISRSREFFHYRPGPGVIAIDSDTKGQPDDVRARLEAAGGVWSALVQAMPELAGIGRVVRASTTAGLSAAGKPIAGGTGEHIYILVEDIADTDRFLTAAQGRCWLAGFGWYLISASGEPLVRSIVDVSTGQPERLFYEGAPELGPGLTQDATARRARVVEGKALNTAAVALTEAELAELATLLAAEKLRYGEQASATRAAWLADHIRRGGSEKTFRLAAEHHQLVPDFPLHFSSLGMATVADVLAHIETYAGRYLADPLEGVDYGKTKAIVLRGNGTPYVRSFAHGLSTLFFLTDKAAGEAADIGEVEAALATLGGEADWHRAALATHAATGGSEEGWAALNGVHPIEREAWAALQPAVVTAGTLFYLANEAQPGWREEYTARLEGELEKTNEASINTDDNKGCVNGGSAPPKVDGAAAIRRALDEAIEGPPGTRSFASRQLIKTSAEFVASLKPPDYLIKGVLQRRFIYSMTAPTGAGKTCIAMRIAAHVAFGVPLLGRPVKQGGVLFLAGENPDDVKMRWIKLAEEMAVDVNTSRICWLDARVPLSKKELRQRIAAEVAALGEVALVIVDTSAAYFEGNDENDNVQAGNHARAMRGLVDLPGGPTVLVTCHPVKNPDLENLVPRGGGAFVNEVDGNLVCPSKGGGIVEVHWHVKFRGPDFTPIPFRIAAGQSEKLKDSDGEKIWTVTAAPVTAAEQEAAEDTAARRRGELLVAMAAEPGATMKKLAEAAGWRNREGDANKSLVQRVLKELKDRGLAKQEGGSWLLTKVGAAKAKEIVEQEANAPF